MSRVKGSKVYTIYGQKYTFTQKHFELMKQNKLEMKRVRSRVHSNWTIEEAVSVPYRMSKQKYYELQEIKRIEEEQEQCKKWERPKPWLKKYPQKTRFGDYAQLLFQECCGSW